MRLTPESPMVRPGRLASPLAPRIAGRPLGLAMGSLAMFVAGVFPLVAPSTGLAQAPAAAGAAALRSPEELDELLGPIALYPDALIALILPAAGFPDDLAAALAYINAGKDPSQDTNESWDDSVKGLVHYPDIIKWMTDNAEWTQQLGDAFLAQPADVMKSIQQLRARAISAGTLASTPQQTVIMDDGQIRIVPAQPNVVYIPRYDSSVVYEDQPVTGPLLSFDTAYPIGPWLGFDLDWDTYGIWVGGWRPGYDYRNPPWRHRPGGPAPDGHLWRPAPGHLPPHVGGGGVVGGGGGFWNHTRPGVVQPRPIPGAPTRTVPHGGAVSVVHPGEAPANPAARAPVYNNPAQNRGYEARGYEPRAYTRTTEPRGVAPVVPGAARVVPGNPPVAHPSTAPLGDFGGYRRGSEVRAESQRGQMSRQSIGAPAGTPHVAAPAPAPHMSAPAPAPHVAAPPPQPQQPGNPGGRR